MLPSVAPETELFRLTEATVVTPNERDPAFTNVTLPALVGVKRFTEPALNCCVPAPVLVKAREPPVKLAPSKEPAVMLTPEVVTVFVREPRSIDPAEMSWRLAPSGAVPMPVFMIEEAAPEI